MAISRAQLQKSLLPGLNALFGMEYKNYEEQHRQIYEVESSSRSFEEEQGLSGFAAAGVKDEGDAVVYDHAQETWTARYTHTVIAQGFALTEEAWEDNLYDTLSRRYTKALARSMAYTKQTRAADILNTGFTTYNAGDGVTLFSTAHPLVFGAALSNRAALDLNEASLEAAIIQIADWTDERGLKIACQVRKAIIPVNLSFTMERIMKSPARVSTSDNDLNALKSMGAIPEGYVVNNYLTDTNAWFLKTDVPGGMKHFERVKLKTASETDFDTGNMKFKARERYSFGCTDWRGIWGSPGTS